MSLFLLHPGQSDRIVLQKYQSKIQNRQLPPSPLLSPSPCLPTNKTPSLYPEPTQDPQIKENCLVLRTLPNGYKISVRVRQNRVLGQTRISLSLITPNETLFKVPNLKALSQINARVNREMNNLKLWMLKIAFSPASGHLHLHLPAYHDFSNLGRGQSLPEFINKHHLQPYLRLFDILIREATAHTASHFQNYLKTKSLENVFRYQEMMHVYNHFNESRLETEQEGVVSQKLKSEGIRRTVENKVPIDEWLSWLNFSLYQHRSLLTNLLPRKEKDFLIQQQQLKYIRTMISMPTQPRQRNPYENLMVLNHIYVHDIFNLRLNKINQGGFSSIFLAEIKYFYVYSAEEHELMHPSQLEGEATKKMLHKYVVIKKEEEGCVYRRNPHELKVLSMIKNGSSIFLPKYYIIVNKSNPHASSVVMDFIPSKNLKEYLHATAASVTLTTKLFLIFSIVQALRYIRDYRIVHLDLKPNNVMIYCNMLVKLIDFGESYHHEVCTKKHQPGYTIPYSPPEIFRKQTSHYSAKSDIFSLGVVIFEMLYGIYPYDIFETDRVEEIMEHYLQKWYFTPEEYEQYGDITVLRILNGIIGKCLAVEVADRPELDLVALVVRQCFELLQ